MRPPDCSASCCSSPPPRAASPPAACAKAKTLVRQKDLDLANLAELSQYIVQHLRESLLVVDAADKIRLINESAAEILGDNHAVPGALVGEVSPRLLYSLSTWRQREQSEESPSSFVAADGARVIQPHFAPLGDAPWTHADFSRRHQPDGRTRPAKQTGGARHGCRPASRMKSAIRSAP